MKLNWKQTTSGTSLKGKLSSWDHAMSPSAFEVTFFFLTTFDFSYHNTRSESNIGVQTKEISNSSFFKRTRKTTFVDSFCELSKLHLITQKFPQQPKHKLCWWSNENEGYSIFEELMKLSRSIPFHLFCKKIINEKHICHIRFELDPNTLLKPAQTKLLSKTSKKIRPNDKFHRAGQFWNRCEITIAFGFLVIAFVWIL